MAEPGVRQINPIQCGRLNIPIEALAIEVLRDDPKLFAIAQCERGARNARCADEVYVLTCYWEDA